MRSTALQVGSLGLEEMGMLKDFEESKFKEKENKWEQVKDFNWMKQEQSPNFELVRS